MKRGYGVAGIVIVLILIGTGLFLPNYLARRDMEKLAGSLPQGTSLTYTNASYSLLKGTFRLQGAALHIGQPAMDITADEVDIQDGNSHLGDEIQKAAANPGADTGVTKIAGRIVIQNLHTVYGTVDVKTKTTIFDAPRVDLGELYTPLPALQPDTSFDNPALLSAVPSLVNFRSILQKTARASLAFMSDKSSFEDATIEVTGTVPGGGAVTGHIATYEAVGGDNALQKSADVADLTISIKDYLVSVQKFSVGAADYRTAYSALRDGAPLQQALSRFGAVHETIDQVALQHAGQEVFSIAAITADRSPGQNGAPQSFGMTTNKMSFNLAALPQMGQSAIFSSLGLAAPVFDAALSYQFDEAAGTMAITNSTLTLENGGMLTLNSMMTDVKQGAPATLKIAAMTIDYQDNSLLSRWENYMAQSTGKPVDQIKAGIIQGLQMQGAANANSPQLAAAYQAVETFVANPHILTLAMQPQSPISPVQMKGLDPQTIIVTAGLSLTAH